MSREEIMERARDAQRARWRTTDAYSLEQMHSDFDWLGNVIALHHIGPYHIVEYKPYMTQGSIKVTNKLGKNSQFGLVINGHNQGHSYSSMDEALLGGIARKNNEVNHANHLARAAARMLCVPEIKEE